LKAKINEDEVSVGLAVTANHVEFLMFVERV